MQTKATENVGDLWVSRPRIPESANFRTFVHRVWLDYFEKFSLFLSYKSSFFL